MYFKCLTQGIQQVLNECLSFFFPPCTVGLLHILPGSHSLHVTSRGSCTQ